MSQAPGFTQLDSTGLPGDGQATATYVCIHMDSSCFTAFYFKLIVYNDYDVIAVTWCP